MDFTFPTTFKISTNTYVQGRLSFRNESFGINIIFPNITYISAPILGTSSLPSENLPVIQWKDVDAVVYDTLEPVEIDSLHQKTPIVWHLKGKLQLVPIVESKSSVNLMPFMFSFDKYFGNFGIGISASIGKIWGGGGWKAKYVGGEFDIDTFWVDSVEFEADVFKQLYHDSLGYYEYNFSIQPKILYHLGLNVEYFLENLAVGFSFDYVPSANIEVYTYGRYSYVDSLYGRWIRKYWNFDNMYSEYRGDTVVIKGDGIVGFMTDSQNIKRNDFSDTFGINFGGYKFYSVHISYTLSENRWLSLSLSNRGMYSHLRFGWDYGLEFKWFLPFEREIGIWRLGAFADFEGIDFTLFLGRNFGYVKTPYFEYKIPAFSGKFYEYTYGLALIYNL